jgi:cell division protein FtsL
MSKRQAGSLIAIVLPAVLLVLSSLSLVTAQHRARSLFVELDRTNRHTRELETDGNRLRIDLGKAAQPAAVAAAARALGLRPTEAKQSVFLPTPAPEDLVRAGTEVRR